MRRYEYRTIKDSDNEGIKDKVYSEEFLNEMGKQGWRLVPVNLPITGCLFLMEREIPAPNKIIKRTRSVFGLPARLDKETEKILQRLQE
jgi:hypothetical protein